MDFGLNNARVLVTGERGAQVLAQYNTNKAAFDTLLQRYPDDLSLVQADITLESDVQRIYDNVPFDSPIQILVLGHGLWPTTDIPMADMTLEHWNRTLNVNLTSNFLLSRGFLKALRGATDAQKSIANIISIGSTAGKYGEANHADYASAKSAIMYGFTLSLKNEIVKIAPRGRINCIGPGWVKTPMAEEAMKDRAVVYRSLATTPLKKIADAIDIATQVLVLSSPTLSGHVTGQVLMVEGGMEGTLLNHPEDVELPP
ncbi:hypothetical protein Clacol_008310 [Clathrus columnatus]|uniref:NAD(P)-binding protein n=1 Tax=Clathrus columnatus TaxID=1419009 RepID=A0AAV5AMZ2_9AGAM|nr:hypothetical protein Clacol_008310 [Clathrus columnatus]